MRHKLFLLLTCGIAVIIYLSLYGASLNVFAWGSQHDDFAPGLQPSIRQGETANTLGLVAPVTLEPGLGRWEKEQERRKNTLKRVCEKMSKRPNYRRLLESDADQLYHLIVNDKHRTIYCYLPKVGSSNWMKVFVILNGLTNKTKAEDVGYAHPLGKQMELLKKDIKIDEIIHKLEKYTKVIAVRSPFERLLSAYNAQINPKHGPTHLTGRVLDFIKIKRSNATISDLTFPLFVDYFINTELKDWNHHYMPYTSLCYPCDIDYDVIVKFESLEEDTERFLRLIGAPKALHYPYKKKLVTSNVTESHLKNLTPEQIAGILKYFGDDFDLFDYEKPVLQNN